MHLCEGCKAEYRHPLAAALCCDPGFDPLAPPLAVRS